MSNLQKIFESVVSIDAWRTSFDPETSLAKVHVDVSFLRGKLGDEPESPIRFEVALRRAEIIFVIPANEPIHVVQSSVKREPPIIVRAERTKESESQAKVGVAANANTGQGLSLGLDAAGSKSVSTRESVKTTMDGGAITWAQSKAADGQYRWELAPATAKYLLGKAWDAVSEPILSLKAQSQSRIDPVARVEIRCRREDLEIFNVVVKDDVNVRKWISLDVLNNKMAAAEAFVVNALSARNLDVRNFNDPFGEIMLADTMVQVGE